MPGLDNKSHVNTLRGALKSGQPQRDGLYGLQWGDPDKKPALLTIRDRWLLPYVRPDQIAIEIGPGGGRWTRYMLPFKRLYAVDYHAELLQELRKNFPQPHIVEIRNNGADFPGVPPASVDFVFSFGTFVHLDVDIIGAYLENLRAVVHRGSQIVIQYSDKTKEQARNNRGFSENNPRVMRVLVEGAGFKILEEDNEVLGHSGIMRFALA